MERKCPVCHKAVKASFKKKSDKPEYFPFCSQRCKLIDLGRWVDEQYRIDGEKAADDDQKEGRGEGS